MEAILKKTSFNEILLFKVIITRQMIICCLVNVLTEKIIDLPIVSDEIQLKTWVDA